METNWLVSMTCSGSIHMHAQPHMTDVFLAAQQQIAAALYMLATAVE